MMPDTQCSARPGRQGDPGDLSRGGRLAYQVRKVAPGQRAAALYQVGIVIQFRHPCPLWRSARQSALPELGSGRDPEACGLLMAKGEAIGELVQR